MNKTTRATLFTALFMGTALAAVGCDQQNSPETTGQKLDRVADKVASNTSAAASRTAEAMDDRALTAKVKAAILAEPGLKSMQIGVETHEAVVTLSGSVDSAPLKDRAKQIASSIAGVRDVVDNLVTRSAQSG